MANNHSKLIKLLIKINFNINYFGTQCAYISNTHCMYLTCFSYYKPKCYLFNISKFEKYTKTALDSIWGEICIVHVYAGMLEIE